MSWTVLDGKGRRMVFPRDMPGDALGALMDGLCRKRGQNNRKAKRDEWIRLRDELGFKLVQIDAPKTVPQK